MKVMRWTAVSAALALFASLAIVDQAFAPPTVIRTGVTIHKIGQVTAGLVVYAGNAGEILAVDLNGVPVVKINPPTDHTYDYARPLDSGNILVRLVHDITGERWIQELDQVGHVIFNWPQQAPYVVHHDHSKLPNGNYLLMCAQEFIDLDVSPLLIEDDCVLEVDPSGTIVWSWQTADHFDQFDFSPEELAAISDHAGDWAHGNAVSAIPVNTSHTDPRFAPGNLVISYRFLNRIIIVDRTTGDIVWQTDNGFTLGQHDVEMLPDDLDGGGNIIVFDNGLGGHYNFGGAEVWRSFSRVIEIDPTDFSIPYQYKASNSGRPDFTFNSYFISSAQRLPTGNTFICEGAFGRMFEVNPQGQIVWEMISKSQGTFQGQPSVRVYRAEKMPNSWLQ